MVCLFVLNKHQDQPIGHKLFCGNSYDLVMWLVEMI